MTLEERFTVFANDYVLAYPGRPISVAQEMEVVLYQEDYTTESRISRMRARYKEARLAVLWFDYQNWMAL